MRYLELVRTGDHVEIRPPARRGHTVHRIQKQTGRLRGPVDVAETLEFSEITGEPFEAKPAPGTARRKKPTPPAVVSYGLNDMDRISGDPSGS